MNILTSYNKEEGEFELGDFEQRRDIVVRSRRLRTTSLKKAHKQGNIKYRN